MATWATHLSVLRSKLQDLDTDPTLQYWTDSELLEYANRAMREIARKVRWYRPNTTIDLVANQAVYDLPADCWELISLRVNGIRLLKRTSASLDANSDSWQTVTGTPIEFVRDELGETQVRLYPCPDTDIPGGLSIAYNAIPAAFAETSDPVSLPIEGESTFYNRVMAEAYEKENDRQNFPQAGQYLGLYMQGLQELLGRRAQDVEADILLCEMPIGFV